MSADQAESVLRQGLKFLESEGFKMAELKKAQSKDLGVFYTVSYHSEESRRGVAVAYFPELDCARATIEDLDQYFCFSDSGAMGVPSPEYKALAGEKEEKLANYLNALKAELQGRYRTILHGEKFENDAFDWTPYK